MLPAKPRVSQSEHDISNLSAFAGAMAGEAQQEIELLYRAVPGAVVRVDSKGIIRGYKLDRTICSCFGEGPWLGKQLSDMVSAEAAKELLKIAAEQSHTGESEPYKYCGQPVPGGAAAPAFQICVHAASDQGAVLLFRDVTAEEDELTQSQQHFHLCRAALDHALEFFGVTTPDGVLLDANQTALDFCRTSRAHVINKPFWQGPWWTHSAKMQRQLQVTLARAAGGEVSRFEATHVAPDGRTHYVDFSAQPVRGADGRVAFLTVEGHDISSRKSTEEALYQSEQMLRVVLDAIPQGVFWKDRELRYLGCNRNAALNSGLNDPQDIVGKSDFDLAWSAMADDYRTDDMTVIESGQSKMASEERLVLQDSTERWVRANKIPLRDREGQVIGLLGTYEDITDRKRTEESLRMSKEQFSKAFQVSPVIMLIVSQPDGRIVEVNKAFERRAGYSREEAIGRTVQELGLLEPESPINLLTSKREEGSRVESVEVRVSTRDGQLLIGLVSTEPIDFESQPCLLVVMEDVTGQRRTERELKAALENVRESQDSLTGIINSIQDPISVKDEDRRFILVNNSMCRLMGRTREEVIGGIDDDFFPEEQVDVFRETDQQVMESGEDNENEEVLTDSLGNLRTILTKKSLYRDPMTGARYLVAVMRDITERKKLEMQRDLMSAAVESAAEVVVVTNTLGTIEYANSAVERVSGFTRTELIGHNANINRSGYHDTAFYKDLWGTIKSGRIWNGKLKNKRKDGSLYDEEATISPVFDKRGQINHFVAVKRDITQELLLEEQLRQSQKLEAVGILAGGVAHDFNNMMTAIVGYASMLQKATVEPQNVFACAEGILDTAARASALTRQLLTYSRSQAIGSVRCDINDRLQEIADMLQRLIRSDIELNLALAENVKPIFVDPTQLDQVVLNLVVNARDAMPEGGMITLATRNRHLVDADMLQLHNLSEGEYVELTCTDTGTGMTPEVAVRIFDPFFTTKEQGKGTGLGLSTVYGIVKQAKGYIGVKSEVGKGSCFTILFPTMVRDVVGETVELPEKEEPHVPKEPTLLLSGTALLVAGNETSRAAHRPMLEGDGFEVVEAVSLEEAAVIAQHWPGDITLLLTDMAFSEEGTETHLTQMVEKQPNMCVVLLSDVSGETKLAVQRLRNVRIVSAQTTPSLLLKSIREGVACLKDATESSMEVSQPEADVPSVNWSS